MIPAHHPPIIPGWNVHHDDGMWVAVRAQKLSEYAQRWGALDEVHARRYDELLVLCDAQTRLAERLTTAQACHPTIEPARKRM